MKLPEALQKLIDEDAEVIDSRQGGDMFSYRAGAQTIADILLPELDKLKAQNWVLKDSQLRTYDGLAQKADKADLYLKIIEKQREALKIAQTIGHTPRCKFDDECWYGCEEAILVDKALKEIEEMLGEK